MWRNAVWGNDFWESFWDTCFKETIFCATNHLFTNIVSKHVAHAKMSTHVSDVTIYALKYSSDDIIIHMTYTHKSYYTHECSGSLKRYFHGNYHIERESYTTQTTYKLLRLAMWWTMDEAGSVSIFSREEFRIHTSKTLQYEGALYLFIFYINNILTLYR